MVKPKRFGVGIIGCGAVSKAHLSAFEELTDSCVVKAVADICKENARKIANLCSDEVDAYSDITALLKRDDIDVVSICTPPFLHKEQVIQAFEYGKHVICEKPFAPSLADCDAMTAAADRLNKKLCVTLQLRFGKDINKVKHIVQSGALGHVYFAEMKGLYWRGDSYYGKEWRGTWEKESGGVMMTQGIHPLDLFIDILGPVNSVRAETATLSHSIEVEDYVTASLSFENGSQGQVLCTLNSVENGNSMKFSGKTKAVSWPLVFNAIKESEGGFPIPDENGLKELEAVADEVKSGREDHFAPIANFFEAIAKDQEPLVNGIEARRSIEVVTAVYKSATLGKKVTLPITTDDPWYTTQGILQHIKQSKPTTEKEAGH